MPPKSFPAAVRTAPKRKASEVKEDAAPVETKRARVKQSARPPKTVMKAAQPTSKAIAAKDGTATNKVYIVMYNEWSKHMEEPSFKILSVHSTLEAAGKVAEEACKGTYDEEEGYEEPEGGNWGWTCKPDIFRLLLM